jgi:hypothetical protein
LFRKRRASIFGSARRAPYSFVLSR